MLYEEKVWEVWGLRDRACEDNKAQEWKENPKLFPSHRSSVLPLLLDSLCQGLPSPTPNIHYLFQPKALSSSESVCSCQEQPKRYGSSKVTAINYGCAKAIFISESGLPFVSCPANVPKCWPFVCKVQALESPPNTRGIVSSYWQPGTTHLHRSIPGKENEPETELKELQFVAGECHLKFYSCLMLFSGRSCSILQSWLIWPLWVILINLACFSLVELCMKWSGFLQTYLLFIRILRIVWTNTFQLATCLGWWFAIHFPLSMVCDLSSKSNAITSVCQGVTEAL